jgi:hypothetical protein
MLEDITLYEFNNLNDNEKYEAIMEYATLVGDRFESQFKILLYQFDNFYVELFYNSQHNAIDKFRSFINQDLLIPYLNQIDLKELK